MSIASDIETVVSTTLRNYTDMVLGSVKAVNNLYVPEDDKILDITDISREVYGITIVGVPVLCELFNGVSIYWQLGYCDSKVKLVLAGVQITDTDAGVWDVLGTDVFMLDESNVISSFEESVKCFLYSFF